MTLTYDLLTDSYALWDGDDLLRHFDTIDDAMLFAGNVTVDGWVKAGEAAARARAYRKP